MSGQLQRRFHCGLVVGKFCPLHLGHEWLIGQALIACDEVLVISYTKPGFLGYERDRRQKWLTSRFPEALCLVIDDDSLAARCRDEGIVESPDDAPATVGARHAVPAEFPPIPPDDAPDDAHRVFVAWLCGTLLRKRVDAVFTSEDYGDGFADVLSARLGYRVKHVCVDRARAKFPVSGTQIRSDPHGNREYLAPEIYADFVQKICLLGGESSGKTSLAAALAHSLNTLVVPEYGRTLWNEKRGNLQFPDMLHIARTQIERENEMAQRANRFLICDTSPLTTFLYSGAMFGKADPELARLAERHYDLVFLCAPDFAFVQDGTRRDDGFRMYQHRWYETELANRGIPYMVLSGALEVRLARAVSVVNEMFMGENTSIVCSCDNPEISHAKTTYSSPYQRAGS